MIIWLAMLIPIVCGTVAYFFWKKEFVWWELLVPTAISFVFILIFKFGIEKSLLSDTQYRGGMIVEARYYEYWSTWVEETCSYCCDHDKKGNCTRTCYYDCSYCSEHGPYWQVYDNQGHSWNITEEEYNRLRIEWNATPQFVELNRSIETHGSCGKDGDMYSIKWDGGMLSAEPSTWETSYENHVQVSKTNFGINDVSEEDAKKYGLYEYPKIEDGYKQTNILGLDSMNYLSQPLKNGALKLFGYLNGMYGPTRKMRVFVLLFSGKSFDIAIRQKDYWVNGNKNEVVICIDVDRNTGKINWVYPFSWAENKRIMVDLREDISNLQYLDFTKMYHIVDDKTKSFVYRDFSQFNYLAVDPPKWEVWVTYIVTLLITIGILRWEYINEFTNDENDPENRDFRGRNLRRRY